jgi:hypothetical protein
MPLFTNPEADKHAFNAMLADILIERLNKLIKDPEVRADISNLIEIRIPVNKTTRQHPTLQVVDGMFLGTLGLINGLVGVIPDGPRKDWGYIAADFDDENKLVKFLRTPMPKRTRLRVVEAVKQYMETHGQAPTTVYFTKQDEEALEYEARVGGEEDLGERGSSNIQKFGARGELSTFLGYRIVWDANEFKVST